MKKDIFNKINVSYMAIPDLNRTKIPTFSIISEQVCKYFGVPFNEVTGKSRKRKIAISRQLICYILMKQKRYSLNYVGKYVNRDHATVIHSVKTIQNLIDTDKNFALDVGKVEDSIIIQNDKKLMEQM